MSKTAAEWMIPLRKAVVSYPQPVAWAAGQLLRSRTAQEQVDACLKAAEVVARYLYCVALASYRCRTGPLQPLAPLQKPLSFGNFLTTSQSVARMRDGHPAALYLAPLTARKGRGPAEGPLIELLELRNKLGHNLRTLSQARAASLLASEQPLEKLAAILAGLDGMLSCPLFVVEEQQLVRGKISGRVLWLMGETRDPMPEEIVLTAAVEELMRPYVALPDATLPLWPYLVWDILRERQSYGLRLIDAIRETEIECQSLDGDKLSLNGEAARALRATFVGPPGIAERPSAEGNRSLHTLWQTERERRLEAESRFEGAMPWDDFDPETVRWYAHRLAGKPGTSPQEVISERLLDNRTRFSEREIREASLLFGTRETVRRVLKRDMIDLRCRNSDAVRYDERYTDCANVLHSLRSAVDFFARHIDLADASLESLVATEGSPDYLAMREALVNLVIHQDYTDPSAPGQVELIPQHATFFNTGYSLVSDDKLDEGGRSQARNPLIARGLRLIGFAELAGSGIRTVRSVWQQARRTPPQFASDREANNFTVALDWRPLEKPQYDPFWQRRLGVKLEPQHLRILNAVGIEGATGDEVLSRSGLGLEEAAGGLQYLQVQGVLECHNGRYALRPHLLQMLERDNASGPSSDDQPKPPRNEA